MPSEKQYRNAIDGMARRIRESHQQQGKPMSGEQARKQAQDIARRHDRKYNDR
jgi:hypothetical protein